MNREDAKILAPIIKAFGEGADITLGGSPLSGEISFDDSAELYEVKPEPEVIWVNKYKHSPSAYIYSKKEYAIFGASVGEKAPNEDPFEYFAKKFIAAD